MFLFQRKNPVNIAIIQPSGYIHSMAFLEVAEYFAALIRKCGYPATISKNTFDHRYLNIVLGAHLLKDANVLPPGTIVFNSEQIKERAGWFQSDLYQNLLTDFCVWDYSAANLLHIPSEKKYEIPFYYCRSLERIPRKQRDIDLLFYGSMNERRQQTVDKFRGMGINVVALFGIYGPERDAVIARSRAILNLHHYDAQILEQVRCFYPLINGKPVISENYPLETAPAAYENALFLPGEQTLPLYVAELLNDKPAFELAAHHKTEAFRKLDPMPQFEPALAAALQAHRRVVRRPVVPSKMNLGTGGDYRPGYLNIDINPSVSADLVLDLSKKVQFPFKVESKFGQIVLDDNVLDEIVALHVLEHVPDLSTLMTQCLRLLKVGGKFRIEVPYDLSHGAWQDPTHVRGFNEKSWLYYTDWFWYMGWLTHRFDREAMGLALSPLGKDLQASGMAEEELLRTPRAVNAIAVTLVKRETTIEERQFARSVDSQFHLRFAP